LLIPGLGMAAKPEVDLALTLFGESASRVILSVDKANVDKVLACAKTANVPARVIGSTGGSRLRISVSGTRVIDIEIGELETMWAEALGHNFVDRVA